MYSDPLTQKLESEFTQDLIFYTREWTRNLTAINPIRPVPPPALLQLPELSSTALKLRKLVE